LGKVSAENSPQSLVAQGDRRKTHIFETFKLFTWVWLSLKLFPTELVGGKMADPKKFLHQRDLAEILGISPEALSMRLSRDPASLPPRWFPPGADKKRKRQPRIWHPDEVGSWQARGLSEAAK
jgi:hypothetical protein